MGTRWRGLSAGATNVAVAYVVLSGAWVVVTDWWLDLTVENARLSVLFETGMGLLFVTLSGVLIFGLVRRERRRVATADEERERALEYANVLHRLLRHNLRNSCDVIRNNVDLLQSGRGNRAASQDRIRRQADAMTTIAEKSRHLRDAVTEGDAKPVEQDLNALVEESIAAVGRQYPGATFVVESSPSQRVVAHPRLAVAIEELLSNAVSHHEASSPRVTVTTGRDGEHALLRIADDGPGLPDVERTVLEDGVEDALTHSRGIGLWVVRFVVTASDGNLTVPASSDDGTVVVLRLPVVEH